MNFGDITIIHDDTFFPNMYLYFDYEIPANETSKIIISLDNKENDKENIFEINWDKEIEKSTQKPKTIYNTIPFYIKIENIIFYKKEPYYNGVNKLVLETLTEIFEHHVNWSLCKSSVYNCIYYILSPSIKEVFSILKISQKRYIFAYCSDIITIDIIKELIFNIFRE